MNAKVFSHFFLVPHLQDLCISYKEEEKNEYSIDNMYIFSFIFQMSLKFGFFKIDLYSDWAFSLSAFKLH